MSIHIVRRRGVYDPVDENGVSISHEKMLCFNLCTGDSVSIFRLFFLGLNRPVPDSDPTGNEEMVALVEAAGRAFLTPIPLQEGLTLRLLANGYTTAPEFNLIAECFELYIDISSKRPTPLSEREL